MLSQIEVQRSRPGEAASDRLPEADEARPVYLQTAAAPTFAMVHAPAQDRCAGSGVVICPPLGWDEECTYRTRRAWAQTLAAHGHPTIRVDLAGTGDSADPADPAEQLAAWTAAVTAAAAWLRDEFATPRIATLGIGVGGILAWIAVAQGAPIDDLILWGVPTRGRQAVRELRAAAKLEIDWRVSPAQAEFEDATAGDPAIEGLLHQGGQVLDADTVAALGAIDLRRIPWPDAPGRRVLLFQRTGVKSDRDLVEQLQAGGVSLTVADGDSYGELMRYVQESVIPDAAIARSLHWLDRVESHDPGASALHLTDIPDVTPSLEMSHGGVLIRETPVTIELSGERLFAIITEPVEPSGKDLCALLLSGGSDRRIGPNRQWVDVARQWAARGVACVRFDIPGTGDGEGDERALDRLRDHYEPAQITRAGEMIDALQARGLANRFVVVGFCSGSYRALHLASGDARVVGVFSISLPFFQWTWAAVNIRDSWLEVREPRPHDSAIKLRVIPILQRFLHVLKRGHHWGIFAGQLLRNRGERMLAQLAARDVEILLLLKPASNAYEQLSAGRRRTRLRKLHQLSVQPLPGNDGRFRPLVSQRFVRDALDDALGRLLARGSQALQD